MPFLWHAHLARDSRWDARATLAFAHNPMLVPQTQIEQAPQIRAPIAHLTVMFVGHALDERIVKEVSLADRRVHQLLSQVFAFGSAKPLAHRRAESALRLI